MTNDIDNLIDVQVKAMKVFEAMEIVLEALSKQVDDLKRRVDELERWQDETYTQVRTH
jgi:hypothetical protein